MKVTRDTAVRVFEAIQFATASKWPEERISERLNKLHEVVDDDTVFSGTPEDQEILDQLVADSAKGKNALADEDDAIAAAAPAAATKPAPPVEEEAEVEEEVEEESEAEEAEEVEEEVEEEEPEAPPAKPATKKGVKNVTKPAAKPVTKKAPAAATKPAAAKGKPVAKAAPAKAPAKAAAKAAPAKKGPGVIASIVKMLTDASEQKPITKAQILKKLGTMFPDGTIEPGHGMHITVTVQVPHRLREDKRYDVRDNGEKAYWIPRLKDGSPKMLK